MNYLNHFFYKNLKILIKPFFKGEEDIPVSPWSAYEVLLLLKFVCMPFKVPILFVNYLIVGLDYIGQ